MRTPLTYYGGKQRLAPQIVPFMPEHRIYFEPFAGGAAVLFHKPRVERETLNDLYGIVMRFWRAVRDHPLELAQAVQATPYSRTEWRFCREACRAPDAETDDVVEAARRFIVYIDQSFSREGTGWSPPSILFDRRGRWQAGVWENLPQKLVAAAERLSGVCLEDGDGPDLIPRFDQPDAVIYIDPPYAMDQRLAPGKGYRHDDRDGLLWPRLVGVLATVENAAVLVSGYPTEHMEDLGWRCVDLKHTRTVQARAGGKLSAAPEVLWLSPNVPEVVPALFIREGAA